MKKKLISGVVGLAMIMSISTTAMAAEIPKESKEIKTGIVKQVEINEFINSKDLNKNEDIVVSIAANDIDDIYNSLAYSIDDLNNIVDKAKFSKNEKEKILKKYKNNEAIEKDICNFFEKTSDLSEKEFIKKIEQLEKKITPIFTAKQLKKIKELKLFPEFKESEDIINAIAIDSNEFLDGSLSFEDLSIADDINLAEYIDFTKATENTKELSAKMLKSIESNDCIQLIISEEGTSK